MSSDVSNLKNKAAYLIGLIKTQKKKVPGLSAEGDMMGGAGDSIDLSQLNITYGKHYNLSNSLGPNVNEDAVKVCYRNYYIYMYHTKSEIWLWFGFL